MEIEIILFIFVQTNLRVECSNDADNHQLKWEGNGTEGSCRHKEEEEDSLLVEPLRVLLSQVVGKLDEDAQGPEDTGDEEEEQSQGSPKRILLETLHLITHESVTLNHRPTALLSDRNFEGIRT